MERWREKGEERRGEASMWMERGGNMCDGLNDTIMDMIHYVQCVFFY